jgi:hypothetical protein
MPPFLNSLVHGVMEWWSIGILKKEIQSSTITPPLQYSNTPKQLVIEE